MGLSNCELPIAADIPMALQCSKAANSAWRRIDISANNGRCRDGALHNDSGWPAAKYRLPNMSNVFCPGIAEGLAWSITAPVRQFMLDFAFELARAG